MSVNSVAMNNAGLNAKAALWDAGAGPAKLIGYTGNVPTRGGADGTKLLELTMSATAFQTSTVEQSISNAITSGVGLAGGMCGYLKGVDGDGNFLKYFEVGVDVSLTNVNITVDMEVTVTNPVVINAGTTGL